MNCGFLNVWFRQVSVPGEIAISSAVLLNFLQWKKTFRSNSWKPTMKRQREKNEFKGCHVYCLSLMYHVVSGSMRWFSHWEKDPAPNAWRNLSNDSCNCWFFRVRSSACSVSSDWDLTPGSPQVASFIKAGTWLGSLQFHAVLSAPTNWKALRAHKFRVRSSVFIIAESSSTRPVTPVGI